jgi:hypothetical protein
MRSSRSRDICSFFYAISQERSDDMICVPVRLPMEAKDATFTSINIFFDRRHDCLWKLPAKFQCGPWQLCYVAWKKRNHHDGTLEDLTALDVFALWD